MTRESEQKPDPGGKGSPGEVMEFLPRHVENTHKGRRMQGINSAPTTLHHELAELYEEFV